MDSKTANILIVDDEPLNLEIIVHTLEKNGYTTKCASNSEQALVLINNHPEAYDLILLDRQMPGMNGLELLKKIKQYDRLKKIPVVMQTALGSKKDVDDGIAAGALYYLTKPFEPSKLLEIVKNAVKDAAAEKEKDLAIKSSREITSLVESFSMTVHNLEDVHKAVSFLSNLYPDPDRVSFGIHALILNALEHGNLGIGYFKKGELGNEDAWTAEINRRIALPENKNKAVHVDYARNDREIRLTIRDEGNGFDWREYLEFNSDRVTHNHGRGIAITKQRCFDGLEYKTPGNLVTAITNL